MKSQSRMLFSLWLIAVGVVIGLLAKGALVGAQAQGVTVAFAPSANYTASVVQDSWVDANQPDANFGGDAGLHVGLVMDPASGKLGERQALVQFDLSGLPKGATVVAATLQLYQTAASGSDAYQVEPDAAFAEWQEATVAWNNRPPNPNLGDPAIMLDYAPGWKQWDVTQIVRNWSSGQVANFGFVLVGVNPVGTPPSERVFNSRNATANWPTLVIAYEGGATATFTASPTATRTRTPTATATRTAMATATRTSTTTATRTATATASPTRTATPTATSVAPTPTPTLIPVVTLPPFIFNPFPPPPADKILTNAVVFGHSRVTQGLDEDISGGVFYDKIAGKDTLARFWAHTTMWDLRVNSAACEVYWWNGSKDVLLGAVPAVSNHAWAYLADWYPSDFGRFDCWIAGQTLANDGWYRFRAILNTADGWSWKSWLGGYREFLPTKDYFGLFLFPAFVNTSVITTGHSFLSAAELAHLTGITLQTFQRELPLRAGIEAIRSDGLNPHTAGLRYYLSPNPYRCTIYEQTTDNLCDANQRAEGNRQLGLFNFWSWIANTFLGKNVDWLDWGEVVVPFDHTGGGQSCWGNQRVGGQGVSLDDWDGFVLIQEVSHCMGLVYQGPHANVAGRDAAHSATGDILMWGAQPMVNMRTRRDESAVEAVMNGGIYRVDDQSMMEGFEWNRLRGIFLGSDPCAGGCAATAGQTGAGQERFYLSGRMDHHDRWITDLSFVITAPVPLPPAPTAGAYAVVVLDAANNELARSPFDVHFDTTHGEYRPMRSPSTLPCPTRPARARCGSSMPRPCWPS